MRRFTEYELLTSPLRRDLTVADDAHGLNVFVPGLMGAGILLSAGILVSDGFKKLFPKSGTRRRIDVTRGVQRIVAEVAAAAGVAIHEDNISRRKLRGVAWYVFGAAASAVVAFVSVSRGIEAYATDGILEENAIAIVFGSVAGGIATVFAVVFVLLALVRNRRIPGVTTLMESTALGRLNAPPESRLDRARLLIPAFREGDIQ